MSGALILLNTQEKIMSKNKTNSNPIFKIVARTRGQLGSSFVFENKAELEKWKKESLPKMEKEYGKLELNVAELPGLKVGDTCHVCGEGDDTFVIKSLIKYSENRYGFVLDSGCSEEVAKCYR
jgi:hypothetical protein